MQALSELYFNGSFEQAKSLLVSEKFSHKPIFIRPHSSAQDSFAIVKRFSDGRINEFSFCQKTKQGKLYYTGTCCSLDILYRVTFYSSKSLRTYIESLLLRDRLPRAQEELACYVDTLFAEELGLFLFHGSYVEAHKYLTSSNKTLVVRPNPRDPLSFFVHKKFARSVCRSFFFKVSKSKSPASCSGFKIKGQAILRFRTCPLTFYSAQSLQEYLDVVKTRRYQSLESEELAASIDTLFCKHVMDVNGSENAILKLLSHTSRAVSITRQNDRGKKYSSLFQVKKMQSGIVLTGPAGSQATSGSMTLCSIGAARIYLANVGLSQPKEKVERVFSQSEIEFVLSLNSLSCERRKLRVDECESAGGSPVSHPASE